MFSLSVLFRFISFWFDTIYLEIWLVCVRSFDIYIIYASTFRFDTVYLDDDIRVAKDIRGDYLVVERAPYSWNG